jgi:hypothetical protein
LIAQIHLLHLSEELLFFFGDVKVSVLEAVHLNVKEGLVEDLLFESLQNSAHCLDLRKRYLVDELLLGAVLTLRKPLILVFDGKQCRVDN